MTTAEKIMKKKTFIKHEADRQLPKAQSDKLWRKAAAELNKILARYADLPKGVHTHTDNFIFPTAATGFQSDVIANRFLVSFLAHFHSPQAPYTNCIVDIRSLLTA